MQKETTMSGFNMTDHNPGAPGGRNLAPDPTQSPPAVTARSVTPADPRNIRLAAGLAAVKLGAAHAAGADMADKAADVAARAFVPAFSVGVRVEYSQLRGGVGIALPRQNTALVSHFDAALKMAARVYSKESGDEADALAGAAVATIDEAAPLLPAERIALGTAACAVARFLASAVQS
jgi:hypothetical protein